MEVDENELLEVDLEDTDEVDDPEPDKDDVDVWYEGEVDGEGTIYVKMHMIVPKCTPRLMIVTTAWVPQASNARMAAHDSTKKDKSVSRTIDMSDGDDEAVFDCEGDSAGPEGCREASNRSSSIQQRDVILSPYRENDMIPTSREHVLNKIYSIHG